MIPGPGKLRSQFPGLLREHAKVRTPHEDLPHCDSSVVFPYPAGATTDTMGPKSGRLSRSASSERRTVPGRTGGRCSFDTTRSSATAVPPPPMVIRWTPRNAS
jgi:hypothetical protein